MSSGFGMGMPGYTVTIGTSAQEAGHLIAQTFVAEGFRYKSAPGTFPVKLAQSSHAASICIETVSEIVPVFLIPAVFRKMLPLKARIRVLDHSAGSSTLRVDMDSVDSNVFTFPIFDKAFQRALTSLTEQGIPVDLGPLTDSLLEKRGRRKNR